MNIYPFFLENFVIKRYQSDVQLYKKTMKMGMS